MYLIFSDSQTQYSSDHDLFAPGELQSVEGSIDQDPAFLNVYDSGTVPHLRVPVAGTRDLAA